MADFMLHHTHHADECEQVFNSLKNAAPSLRGERFFCTCPSGEHGGFFQVEAVAAEEALELLPVTMRATTHVFPGESMVVP